MNIEELKKELKNEVGPKLYNHSIGTMEEAEKLAKVYNYDILKAKVAGLLHDCGKSRCGDNLTHAKKSADLAIIKYGIKDKEIIDAILYHTTGRVNMTLLEKIIYIADKIEPGRNYEGVEELRKIAYLDLNKALIMSLENTIDYVEKRNMELDMESVKALNYLKEER
ncbi:MAG TPA: HD domain-containing protein [Tissierellia bacterium]|nr:HD domain-containing protein [Tissierellia bacterium]